MKTFKICGKSVKLKPYNVRQEIQALMQIEFDEDTNEVVNFNINDVLCSLGLDQKVIDSLTELEKIYVFYLLRSMSVESIATFQLYCPCCGDEVDVSVSFDDLITPGDIDTNICKDVLSDNVEDFFDDPTTIDELDPYDYGIIVDYIDEHKARPKFKRNFKCHCEQEMSLDLSNPTFLCKCISDMSITEVLKAVSVLVRIGKFTLPDIYYHMTPGERTAYLRILDNDLSEVKESLSSKANISDMNSVFMRNYYS